MAVDPANERSAPGPGSSASDCHVYAIPQTEANAVLQRWLQDHPEIAGELKETVRARIHPQELEGRTARRSSAVSGLVTTGVSHRISSPRAAGTVWSCSHALCHAELRA